MANDLDAYKSEQTKLLEAQKARAQESAAINHHKLLKYLEQSSASKGYSVGMTESAKIAAANQYSQDVAAADAAYNQGMGELNHYLRTEQERLDDKAKAEQDATYNRVLGLINDGYYNTSDDIKKYLDGLGEGAVSEEQKNDLLYRYGVIAADPNQQAADEEYNENVSMGTSSDKILVMPTEGEGAVTVGGTLDREHQNNNFTINGNKVELGKTVGEDVVPADQTAYLPHKTVFEYGGKLYIKLGDDVWSVQGRGYGGSGAGYNNILDIYKKARKGS